MKKIIFKWLSILFEISLLLICSLLFIRNTCYMTVIIEKSSMNPTLKDGDYGYALKTKYALTHLNRFDIITFNCDYNNDNTDEMLIKRIIGLPEDKIEFDSNGSLYVNNIEIEQDFISEEYRQDTGVFKCKVPENCYFVLGDNRKVSVDSRNEKIGFISQNQITGVLKVITAECVINNGEIESKNPKPFVYF